MQRRASTDDSASSSSDEDSGNEDQPGASRRNHGKPNNVFSFNQSPNPSHRNMSPSRYNRRSPINADDTEYLWGYGAQYQKYRSSTDRDVMGHIDRPKLLLMDTKFTHADRKRLRPRLKYLIEHGVVRKRRDSNTIVQTEMIDILTDYFVKLLGHSKQQLIEREGYTHECPVAFSLTLPSVWSAQSSRVLQAAVLAAIKATEFGALVNGCLENVFLVSEPEAAATFLLGKTYKMLV